jgi:hypothetical protein
VGNATTLTNAPVIAKVLTGYSSGAGTVAATDSILQAIQKLDGNDSTNADLTGVITSVGNATSIASQTGTGTKFVVDTSPTLVTPNIGVATGTSLAAALNGSLGATTPSTVAATTISGTTGTFTGNVATSQNVNDSASLSSTNASSGTAARARVLLVADAGNAQVFATSTGYTDITGAADSMVFAANSLSGGYQFSIDGNPAVAKVTSTGLNSTAIGATTPSTGAFTTGIINLSSGSDQQETLSVRGNSGVGMLLRPSFVAGTQNNWRVAASIVASDTLEITPSTAVGGTTFTTPVATFTSTGAAITGTLSCTGRYNGSNITLNGNQINENVTNATTSIAISYGGYADGTTQFRDFGVYNGKNGQLLYITGSTGTAAFSNAVTIGGTAQLTGSAPKLEIYHGTAVKANISGTDVLSVSSTGAAITGTLSATGAISTAATGAALTLNSGDAATDTYMLLKRGSGTSWAIAHDSQGGLSFAKNLTDKAYFGRSGVDGLTVTGILSCTGALSKGSGSFRIEHPLPSKSATHQLVHSFIEGPKCDLIYRGKIDLVDGKATVNIDTDSTMTEGTFEALCATVQCFTSNESGWGAIRGKVVGNILTIEAQDAASTDSVSWMVIGERKDPHIMDTDWTDENGRPIVEPIKPVVESK